MTQKDFQALVHRLPFQSFRLHLADGKGLRVPHPDFLLAGVDTLVVATELPDRSPGTLNLIPYEHVVHVELLPRKTRKAA